MADATDREIGNPQVGTAASIAGALRDRTAYTENKDSAEITLVFPVYGLLNAGDVGSYGAQIGDPYENDDRFRVVSRSAEPLSTSDDPSVALKVVYRRQRNQTNGEGKVQNFSYDFSGESENIKTAITQTSYVPEDSWVFPTYDAEVDNKGKRREVEKKEGVVVTADAAGGAIGITPDGIEGVDIESPIITVVETYEFTNKEFNGSFRKFLSETVKTVNKTSFREWDAGEVFMDGVSSTKIDDTRWEVEFRFLVRRNVKVLIRLYKANLVGVDTQVVKKGWHYLWTQTAEFTPAADIENVLNYLGDDITAAAIKVASEGIDWSAFPKKYRPVAAHVSQVYPETEFKQFGIGEEVVL